MQPPSRTSKKGDPSHPSVPIQPPPFQDHSWIGKCSEAERGTRLAAWTFGSFGWAIMSLPVVLPITMVPVADQITLMNIGFRFFLGLGWL